MIAIKTYENLCVIVLTALTGMTEARAAQASIGLRGKSILLSWSRTYTVSSGECRGGICNSWNYLKADIYVSSQGRIFSTYTNGLYKPSHAISGGDDGVLNWRIEGNSLVGDQAFIRGARRIIVDFNDSLSKCYVDIIYGKDTKGSIVVHTGQGDVQTQDNNQISSATCSIKDGNVFGTAQ